jgi:hypothetical protein
MTSMATVCPKYQRFSRFLGVKGLFVQGRLAHARFVYTSTYTTRCGVFIPLCRRDQHGRPVGSCCILWSKFASPDSEGRQKAVRSRQLWHSGYCQFFPDYEDCHHVLNLFQLTLSAACLMNRCVQYSKNFYMLKCVPLLHVGGMQAHMI